jgi:hypothetical protein
MEGSSSQFGGAVRPRIEGGRMHQFYAIAFEENLSLRQLAPFFPNARISAHEIYDRLVRAAAFTSIRLAR